MSAHACSLFEGSYHIGLGRFSQLVVSQWLSGNYVPGYRGELPPWSATASLKDGMADFAIADGCNIKFLLLDTIASCELQTNPRAQGVRGVLAPGGHSLLFRPGYHGKVSLELFREMGAIRLSVSEDCTFPYLPSDHPLRYQWMEVAGSAGLTQKRARADTTIQALSGFLPACSTCFPLVNR